MALCWWIYLRFFTKTLRLCVPLFAALIGKQHFIIQFYSRLHPIQINQSLHADRRRVGLCKELKVCEFRTVERVFQSAHLLGSQRLRFLDRIYGSIRTLKDEGSQNFSVGTGNHVEVLVQKITDLIGSRVCMVLRRTDTRGRFSHDYLGIWQHFENCEVVCVKRIAESFTMILHVLSVQLTTFYMKLIMLALQLCRTPFFWSTCRAITVWC